MRTFSITTLPMLLLAVFILLGGARLAQRSEEVRVPVTKAKVDSFAKVFSQELERLNRLYLNYLADLADSYSTHDDALTKSKADKIRGVAGLYFLSAKQEPEIIISSSVVSENKLPEVAMVGQKVLNKEKAILFPIEYLEQNRTNQSGWLDSPDGNYLVRWVRPDNVRLIAIIVNREQLYEVFNHSLESWMKDLVEPFRSEGTLCEISQISSRVLFKNGIPEGHASLVIPFYTSFGEWQMRTWDTVSTNHYYDTVTLGVAAALALFIALSGVLLFQQQRRSLKLARQRVSFVNQVSHELGSPLTNVALNLELATEQIDSKNTKAKYRLALIAQEVERLNRLVGNVLTFSRHERGILELRRKTCDPNQLITDLLESYQPALERREISLTWNPGDIPSIETDPDALVQIVANLVSNVEKYAFSGKHLLVETSTCDENLVVTVSDKGPGIPKQSVDKIFRSFERVHTGVNEGSSGAGLGLSIAKSLVTKLGGDLTLASYENGCTFELKLPLHSNKN